jgi:hypothetical protein
MSGTTINRSAPDKWKQDIAQSVDLYNSWFMEFVPKTFREMRVKTAKSVKLAFKVTNNLLDVSREVLKENPKILPILRMSTCPPLARDRLLGLAGVSKTLVESMEDSSTPRIPPRITLERLNNDLKRICVIIEKMADPDIFVWLNSKDAATEVEISRAATIVADRLCGAWTDPIIRNAQEERQLHAIGNWLKSRDYRHVEGIRFSDMDAGTYSFRTNIPVSISGDN